MLRSRWSAEAWAKVRVEFRKALAPDGLEAWAQVIEHGYEGYVAKDEASAYEGGATRRWLKVKVPGLDGSRRPLAPGALGAGCHPAPGLVSGQAAP
jgi:hypothetical protein